MKKKVRKFRKWLNRNKVFFEVFSFTFLGLASIIVTVFSYNSSKKQLELLELLELEHRPIINVQRNFISEYESIKVNNVGYHIFEPKVNYNTYFIIKEFNDSIVKNQMSFSFKIKDYLTVDFGSESSTGEIYTIYSSSHALKDSKRLKDECRELFMNNYQNIEIEHYLSVFYKDERNQELAKYYLINSFETIEVSKKDFFRKQKEYDIHNTLRNRYLKSTNAHEILDGMREVYSELIVDDEIHEDDI